MTVSVETASGTNVICLLCGAQSDPWFETSGYWIRQCRSCKHRFVDLGKQNGHVERIYGDDYFTGGAAGYSDYLSEEKLLVARGHWYARRVSRYCKPGTVLDVGAAAGFTLQGWKESGWQCFGIEPNANMAGYATRRFGFPVEAASLESWSTDRTFDLVTFLQVIAHFVDPGKALLSAADLVSPGGHLLIETWNQQSWTARLFGKHWHEYSPPSVLHWFSKGGLIRLAERSGFQAVAHGRPAKRLDAGHAKSLLQHTSKRSAAGRVMFRVAQIIPDGVAIPYPFDDLFWLLLRRV